MDQKKTGEAIRAQRRALALTQEQLARLLGVSDKAVSKWERGLGCPDPSLLTALAEALGVDLAALLSGELPKKPRESGNLKRLRFYVCPDCGNIFTAVSPAGVSCCGKRLSPLAAQRAGEEEIQVSADGDEFFLSSSHEMSREHHVAFVALVSGDTLVLRRLYPQWDLQTRLPRLPDAALYWYCTRHGLFFRPL